MLYTLVFHRMPWAGTTTWKAGNSCTSRVWNYLSPGTKSLFVSYSSSENFRLAYYMDDNRLLTLYIYWTLATGYTPFYAQNLSHFWSLNLYSFLTVSLKFEPQHLGTFWGIKKPYQCYESDFIWFHLVVCQRCEKVPFREFGHYQVTLKCHHLNLYLKLHMKISSQPFLASVPSHLLQCMKSVYSKCTKWQQSMHSLNPEVP